MKAAIRSPYPEGRKRQVVSTWQKDGHPRVHLSISPGVTAGHCRCPEGVRSSHAADVLAMVGLKSDDPVRNVREGVGVEPFVGTYIDSSAAARHQLGQERELRLAPTHFFRNTLSVEVRG